MYEYLADYIPLAIALALLFISWSTAKLFPDSWFSKKVKAGVDWIVEGLGS